MNKGNLVMGLENGVFVADPETFYAIVNGSLHQVEPFADLEPGYYDVNLIPVPEAFAVSFKKYSPTQPRDPKGTSTGGQWTDGGRARVKGPGKNKDKVQEGVDGIPEEHAKLLWDSSEPINEVRVYSKKTVLSNGRQVAGVMRDYRGSGSGIEIEVADEVRDRKVRHPIGTTVHEIGHALDYLSGQGLSDKFGPMVFQWGEKMSSSERYLASHYFTNNREAFAELYRLAYAPPSVKNAFGMGRKAAEVMFAGPLKALKEHRI